MPNMRRFMSFLAETTLADLHDTPAARMADLVRGPDDLGTLDPAIVDDLDFQTALVVRSGGHALEWLEPDLYAHNLDDLIATAPEAIAYVPANLMSETLASIAAHHMERSHEIDLIPQAFHTDAITRRYWELAVRDDHDLMWRDIPHDMRQDPVVRHMLPTIMARHPAEIGQSEHEITAKTAAEIVALNPKAIRELPAHLIGRKIAQDLSDQAAKKPEADLWPLFDAVPPRMWTEAATQAWLDKGDITSFADLPPQFQNEPWAERLLESNPEAVDTVPAEFLPTDMLARMIARQHDPAALIERIGPAKLSDGILLSAMEQTETPDALFAAIPARCRSHAVLTLAVAHGSVPVGQLPSDMRSNHTILNRLAHHPAEFHSVPKDCQSRKLAMAFVARVGAEALHYVPVSLYSEPLLYGFLEALRVHHETASLDEIADDQAVFDKFPKRLWSERVVTDALTLGLVPPSLDAIPEPLRSIEVVDLVMTLGGHQAPDQNSDDFAVIEPLAYQFDNEGLMAMRDLLDIAEAARPRKSRPFDPAPLIEGFKAVAVNLAAQPLDIRWQREWSNHLMTCLKVRRAYHDARNGGDDANEPFDTAAEIIHCSEAIDQHVSSTFMLVRPEVDHALEEYDQWMREADHGDQPDWDTNPYYGIESSDFIAAMQAQSQASRQLTALRLQEPESFRPALDALIGFIDAWHRHQDARYEPFLTETFREGISNLIPVMLLVLQKGYAAQTV